MPKRASAFAENSPRKLRRRLKLQETDVNKKKTGPVEAERMIISDDEMEPPKNTGTTAALNTGSIKEGHYDRDTLLIKLSQDGPVFDVEKTINGTQVNHRLGQDNEDGTEDDEDDYSDSDYQPEEDDSNDESNWRNDYPDSEPEESESEDGNRCYDEDIVGRFAGVNLKGNELSSDEEDEEYVYSKDYDGLDGGIIGNAHPHGSKFYQTYSHEVVSSPGESDEES